MKYVVDDKKLNAATFIAFVNQVWQGSYDVEKTQGALSKTINITAYDNEVLIGCLRILTDGYYFGTITELLVLPEYQKQGVGCIIDERRIGSCAVFAQDIMSARESTCSHD